MSGRTKGYHAEGSKVDIGGKSRQGYHNSYTSEADKENRQYHEENRELKASIAKLTPNRKRQPTWFGWGLAIGWRNK